MTTHKFTKNALQFIENKNLFRGKTVNQRHEQIRKRIEAYESEYSRGLGKRFIDHLRNEYVCGSSPFLNNFGAFSYKEEEEMNTVPLPSSCQVLGVQDNIYDIMNTSTTTVAQMSKLGAGVGIDFSGVSPEGTRLVNGLITNSRLDWATLAVQTASNVSQGSSRRGYAVPQFPLDAPEFYPFMERTSSKNPESLDPLNGNTSSILIPSGVRQMFEGLTTEEMTDEGKEMFKRYLTTLQIAMGTGSPYLSDEDNMNKNHSPVYDTLGLRNTSTNICTEINNPIIDGMDFTCFLGAVNLNHWEYIKNNLHIVEDLFMVLDIVVSEYIRLAKGIKGLERAVYGAESKRDIGVGTLGYHELLQSKDLSFGSLGARMLNKEIFKTIREVGEKVTKDLGERLGSPMLCQEAGMVRRNVSLMCIAPNKTTGFLHGETSGGIEPFQSNYYRDQLAGITHTHKSKALTKYLDQHNRNTDDIWEEVRVNDGSVKTLDFLTENQKKVCRTFGEIPTMSILDSAGDRQEFVDMSQSLNLKGSASHTLQDIYNIHKYAWKVGIKNRYYFYSGGHALKDEGGHKWDVCESCAD